MDLKKFLNDNFTARKTAFLIIFSILALIAQQINFSAMVGGNGQYFSLFNFFAPVAGIFLGPVLGLLAVLLAEIVNYAIREMPWTLVNMLRLIPVLIATAYFGTKDRQWQKRFSIVIPVLAIATFVAHPVGRSAWFYSLFWLIPLLPAVLPKKYRDMLYLRSLGATFTQHAVGGALWIWTVPMTVDMYRTLMFVTPIERALFAGGIAVSYLVFNNLFAAASQKYMSKAVNVDRNYVFFKKQAA